MKVKVRFGRAEVGNAVEYLRSTIDRSGDSSKDLSKSVPVGTRKTANYACVG